MIEYVDSMDRFHFDHPATLDDLYNLAKENQIQIDEFPCTNGAMAINLYGCYFIALDPGLSMTERKERLAHELGHCFTRGFYTIYTPAESREWMETSACRWSYNILLPVDWINDLIRRGVEDLSYSIDDLGLSSGFVNDALEYYRKCHLLINPPND